MTGARIVIFFLLMKLGLGLYRHMLTAENFAFAKQAGCPGTAAPPLPVVLAAALLLEHREDVDRQREHDRRVLLRGNLVERLQVAVEIAGVGEPVEEGGLKLGEVGPASPADLTRK